MRDAGHYPALAEWRRQIAAGERTATTLDDLWRAAAAEQLAFEHERLGLFSIAASFHRDAVSIIRRAAEAERQGESDRRSA
jgi:signal recognition particle GTPase